MTLRSPVAVPKLVVKIIDRLIGGGAKDVLIVGGFVRDVLLGIQSKDVDLEVYGLSYAEVERILAPHFRVNLVGQSFGVIKVENTVDVALPRRESKNGIGHKGFSVDARCDIEPAEAFSRRDFTINAIGMRLNGEFYDPFDGIGDLRRKLLRATSPAFKDDPLRVLRGMQFASRFGFSMDAQTVEFCKDVYDEYPTLSQERVYMEWEKWALKGLYPDLGLDVLLQTGWINAFPELAAIVGCPQNPQWHPEGDVWTHTKQVCCEMARSLKALESTLSSDERQALMFAALCHDFGKPSTTLSDENGVLRSYGHAEAGAPLAREFMTRMKAPFRIVDMVVPLVKNHMATQGVPESGPSKRAVRRLALKLFPATIRLWALLCQADAFGCGVPERYLTRDSVPSVYDPDSIRQERENHKIRFQADVWLSVAEKLEIKDTKPEQLIQGRDLIQLGIRPGPIFSKILNAVFERQLDGEFETKEDGQKVLQEVLRAEGLVE